MLTYYPQIFAPFSCNSYPRSRNAFADSLAQQYRLELVRRREAEEERAYHELLKKAQSQRPYAIKNSETPTSIEIRLFKRGGNFNNYEIRLSQVGNKSYLVVLSNQDDYKKVFEVDENEIEFENIKAEVADGVLVIEIPKRIHEEVPQITKERAKQLRKAYKKQIKELKQQRKEEHRRLKAIKRSKRNRERELKKERKRQAEREQAPEPETPHEYPEVTISFTHPEQDVPEYSETETESIPTESESETHSENELPLHRSPSIEEVEDEEFILYRKRLSGL